jgi:2-C-methyl-D-erythritol 4-phosphate cytidylyltransferase/2-C-methyl-D-erythritol 2,4-cyclodiphosphate synthase
MRVTAIIAAGGAGRRIGGSTPKQLLDIGGESLLRRSVRAFDEHPAIDDLIVVLPDERVGAGAALAGPTRRPLQIVAGGPRRQDSVANAVDALAPGTEIVLVHDAARPFVPAAVISRAIDAAAAHGAAIPAVPATDTVKRVARDQDHVRIVETVARDTLVLAQTPQAFRRDVLEAAVAAGRAGIEATDEAMLAERAGHPVHVIEGDVRNVKITTVEDLARARAGETGAGAAARAGVGYDLHRLVAGRPLILGGVTIPSPLGALGHSDADAAAHAVTDALLGAACLGDIGRHFPDTDPRWKGASSLDLLRQCAALAREHGYAVLNVDVAIVLERPKIAPFLPAIRAGLAGALGIDEGAVSVKGKTNEGVDAVGRGEAIAAHAVALLSRNGHAG